MTVSTPASSAPGPEEFTGLMSSIYALSGESSMVGAFVAGSTAVRSSLLSKLRFDPLPKDLVSAALEVQDDEVLWALSQRDDLSDEALEGLIACDSPLVHRTLASSQQMSSEKLVRLLPGDEFLRQRIFVHPHAGRDLRRRILRARDSSGTPLPRAAALDKELLKPEYALWLLDSDTQQGRMQALTHLPNLPPAYQWRVAWKVAEGAVPLSVALSARGWVPPLRTALQEAISALPYGGEENALGALSSNLRNLGEPPIHAEDEARLLADEAEVEALAAPKTLDWSALERVLRSGDMTVAAVRYLLQREDRTAGFTSAALAFHGDSPGVLALCDLKDLQAASTMSGFALAERARLVKLVVTTPSLPYKFLDLVGLLPVRDVLAELEAADDVLADYQRRRLARELQELLGDSVRAWHDFEAARVASRTVTFRGALEAAGVSVGVGE